MPITPLFFNLSTRKFTDLTNSANITALDGKLHDLIRYELGVFGTSGLTDLSDSAILKMGVKGPEALSGDYLASSVGAKTGSANFARWVFDLNLNTAELDTFLGSSQVAVLTDMELEVVLPGRRISSAFIAFSIEPDVIRGGESAPTPVSAVIRYEPEVSRITGGSSGTNLIDQPTIGLPLGYVLMVTALVSGVRVRSDWELKTGPAVDGNDHEPTDYNLTTNNVHWTLIGGYAG